MKLNLYLASVVIFFSLQGIALSSGSVELTRPAVFYNEHDVKSKFNTGTYSFASFAFTENKGQVYGYDGLPHPEVKFVFQQGNTNIFLLEKGIAYQFTRQHYPEGYMELMAKPEVPGKMEQLMELQKKIRTETFRMDMVLSGANNHAKITTEGKSAEYANYYSHNVLDVHGYSKITYHDIYPGIDWVVYAKNGVVKYDFVVKPNADPSLIKMEFKQHEELGLNADGSFTLKNRLGSVTENKPVSFQNSNPIETRFILDKSVISFSVDVFDSSQSLTIDPSLLWATYYGQTGDDRGYCAATDASGNVYLAGVTDSNAGIAASGYQNTFGGTTDAFLVKFSSAGALLWATYYGGVSGEIGYSCATDASGNVYLAGLAQSTAGIASGGYQNVHGGGVNDAFLVKFSSAGTRLWGTYYGGLGGDFGLSCATDATGNVFLAGYTSSGNGIASAGYQNTPGGINDAFLVKFSSLGAIAWGTYYGDTGNDYGYYCATDASGNVYMAGGTGSNSGIASGGFQNAYGGGFNDAYLVKFSGAGARLWGTYYGSTGNDAGISCTTDASGNIYLSGYTSSGAGIASGGHQNTFGGTNDAFLVKFSSAGARLWATYYGGAANDQGQACATDALGNIYLAGWTQSTSNIAAIGFQNALGGNDDAFLVKFNSNGIRLWGTYYGGSGTDLGRSCVADASGSIYLAGWSTSTSGIALGGYQTTYGGGANDAFLAKLCSNEPNQPLAISGNTLVCPGVGQSYSVSPSVLATSYTWAAPGGWSGSSSTNSIVLLPSASGILSVTASNTCGISLTQTLNITVNSVSLALVKTNVTCNGLANGAATLTPSGGTAPYSYTWTPVGGNSAIATGLVPGNYIADVTDANGCFATQTMVVTQPAAFVVTATVNNPTVCSGNSITLTGSGASPGTYTWSSGVLNGISFIPTVSATYTVIGRNALTGCTVSATVGNTVNITPTITPNNYITCFGSVTTLTANGAATYSWSNGATTSVTTVSPPVSTTYTVTGTSLAGCTGSTTNNVSVNSNPTVTVNSPTICQGNNATLTANGATSYSWSTGVTTSSIIINPAATTNYTVRGTTGICSSTLMATVVVNPPPALFVNSPTVCSGSTATLNAGGALTYSWSTGALTSSISANPVSTTVYTVTGFTAAGCAPAVQTATINISSTPTLVVNSATICSGTTATLTASGVSTFSWSTGATTSVITVSTPVTTIYTVSGFSAAGCLSSSQNATITVNPTPTLSLNSTTICQGFSTTLTANGAVTYSWSTTATTASISVSPTATTVYSVTGTSVGCSSGVTATVFVNLNPTITASSHTICENYAVTFTAGGALTYTWTGPSNYSANGASAFIPQVNNLSVGIYTINATALNTCTSALSVSLSSIPLPTLTTGSSTVCLGGPTTLTSTATAGSTFNWSGPGGTVSATQNASITNAINVLPTIYTLVVTAPNSCTRSATATLVTLPLPTVTASGTVICLNQPYTLIGNGALTYTWTGPNNLSVAAPSVHIANVSASTSGVYTLVGLGANSCTNTNTSPIQVSFMPLPVITAFGATVCAGKTALLKATGGIVSGYTWSGPNNFYSGVQNPAIASASNIATGNYTVIGTAPNTCTDLAIAHVSIMALPLPVFTAPQRVCFGSVLTLQASAAASHTWNGPYNYYATQKDVSFPIYNNGQEGTYTLGVTDNNGCINYTTAVISIDAQPNGILASDNANNFCVPFCSDFRFINAGNSPVIAASWQINNTIVLGDTFTYCLNKPTDNLVVGSFTNALGCTSKINFNIKGAVKPTADFIYSPTRIFEEQELVEFKNTSLGENQSAWNWYFIKNSGFTSSGQTVSYNFTEAGTYAIAMVVTNKMGCSDTVVKSVVVEPDFRLYVPNSFTPDGDGVNDIFQPKGRGVEKYSLTIFDRWSNIVFKTNDFNTGWDGAIKEKQSTDDVFVWKIIMTDSYGRVKEQMGYVTIIR